MKSRGPKMVPKSNLQILFGLYMNLFFLPVKKTVWQLINLFSSRKIFQIIRCFSPKIRKSFILSGVFQQKSKNRKSFFLPMGVFLPVKKTGSYNRQVHHLVKRKLVFNENSLKMAKKGLTSTKNRTPLLATTSSGKVQKSELHDSGPTQKNGLLGVPSSSHSKRPGWGV